MFCNYPFRDTRTIFVRHDAMHCEHDYLRAESEYRDGYRWHGEKETGCTGLVGRMPRIRDARRRRYRRPVRLVGERTRSGY